MLAFLANWWAIKRGYLWGRVTESRAVTGPSPAIRAASPDDVERLAVAMRRSPGVVRRRMDAGKVAYIALVDGQIASYGWVSFGQEGIGELEGSIRLAPGEAYIWDCATVPAFRGRGLFTALLRAMVDSLGERGAEWLWAGTDAHNYASQAAFRRAGFVRIAAVLYLRILGFRRLWISGQPGASASAFEAARRALRA